MASNIRLAKVVGVHPEKHTADLIFLDNGGPFMDAFVACDFASSNTGTVDLPDPTELPINTEPRSSSGRDMIAVVTMFGRIAIIVAFILPQFSQMFFPDHNRRINRHASDVYTSLDGSGNFEFYHPSGTFLRMGATSAHEDLTGKDARGLWKIANNTAAAPYVNFVTANAGNVKTTVLFDPTGNVTVTASGNWSSTFQGTQTLNSTGDATLASTAGKLHLNASSDVDVQAGGNLNSTSDNMTLGASGNGTVTASGTLLLSSGSTATLYGAAEAIIQAPTIELEGAVTVTGVLTTAAISATAVTVGGTPVLLNNQQAADSAKLGGQSASSYLTSASLSGYLALTGGTLSGALTLDNSVLLQSKDTFGNLQDIAFVDGGNTLQLGGFGVPSRVNTGDTKYLQTNLAGTLKKAIAWRDGCMLQSSSAFSIANNTNTVLTWNAELYDDNSYHSTVSNTSRITPGFAGRGIFMGSFCFASNSSGTRDIWLNKNGSTGDGASYPEIWAPPAAGGNTIVMFTSPVMDFTATDYFECNAYQNCGGTLGSAETGSRCWFGFYVVERL